ELVLRQGLRTVLSVPLLREEEAIGALAVRRAEVQPFTEKQIELAETFADQAVIAIENVRLFEAEQQRRRELSEALEQQTAASEVLGVISRSPTDVQPTFEAIAGSARRLCDAANAMVFRFDGELIHLAAYDSLEREQLAAVRSVFPIRPGRAPELRQTAARSAHPRSLRVAGAADGNLGGAARHFQLAWRAAADIRVDAGERHATVR